MYTSGTNGFIMNTDFRKQLSSLCGLYVYRNLGLHEPMELCLSYVDNYTELSNTLV